MELLLGNLLFSLAVKVGGTALGLGLVLWLGFRLAAPALKTMKKTHRRIVKRSAWLLYIVVLVLVTLSVFAGSGPRVTVDDHTRTGPSYETEGVVESLAPDVTTDDERVEETRDIGRENALEDE